MDANCDVCSVLVASECFCVPAHINTGSFVVLEPIKWECERALILLDQMCCVLRYCVASHSSRLVLMVELIAHVYYIRTAWAETSPSENIISIILCNSMTQDRRILIWNRHNSLIDSFIDTLLRPMNNKSNHILFKLHLIQ